jgi:ribosome recycling factor
VARQEYTKTEEKMDAAVDWFRRECAAVEIRVNGRVTSALLDRVRVTLPGDNESIPLEEVASVNVKDGTTLVVSVFEDHVRAFRLNREIVDLLNVTVDLQARRERDL